MFECGGNFDELRKRGIIQSIYVETENPDTDRMFNVVKERM